MDILTSVNAALNIAKQLKKWSDTIQDLEVKMMVSELLSEIADIKVECATLKTESIQHLDKINELQKLLTYREEMLFDKSTGCLYKKEDTEKKIPYCPKCLSEKSKLNNMQRFETTMGIFNKCIVCEHKLQVFHIRE